MARLPSRSTLLVVLAGLVALGTARAVAADLASLHRRAGAAGRATPVVVARRDLTPGATVTAADVDVRRLHEPPPDALRRAGQARGRVVAVAVLAGTPVLRRHLGGEGPAGAVPPGTRAVRVAVDPPWRLPPGAVVDVLAPGEAPGPAETVAAGAVVLEQEPAGGATGVGSRTGVTLLVTVDAARRVATAVAAGPLALALAPPEDACCRTSSSGSSRD